MFVSSRSCKCTKVAVTVFKIQEIWHITTCFSLMMDNDAFKSIKLRLHLNKKARELYVFSIACNYVKVVFRVFKIQEIGNMAHFRIFFLPLWTYCKTKILSNQ